jgi:glutamyl-tRNA synthetase
MTVKVRFAPSPTGLLHLGNARGAVINWLFARKAGGQFLLRLDDTDIGRSTAEFAGAIDVDLAWLGLDWDERVRQSDRLERYSAAAEKLRAAGRLYPAYETPEELERRRFRQVAGGGVQVYDRAALRLSEAQKRAYESEGRKPHWRFLLNPTETAWSDLIRGPATFHGAKLSDPVLVRADGSPMYTLASVVDDIELGITHVIRGEDHVTNTAVQLQIFEALGKPTAELSFAHFSLLTDTGGHNFSKRLGSLSLRSLRDDGIEPMAIAALMARLGTSDPVELRAHMDELIAGFDIARFSRAAPKLDADEIKRLSARYLHELPFAAAAPRLTGAGLGAVDERFWAAVRPNLARFDDIRAWWDVIHGDIAPRIEDRDFAAASATLLPPEPWSELTWGQWTKAVSAATGRKGRELFHPLRLALTGQEQGPELKLLLPMMGREVALRRLGGDAHS